MFSVAHLVLFMFSVAHLVLFMCAASLQRQKVNTVSIHCHTLNTVYVQRQKFNTVSVQRHTLNTVSVQRHKVNTISVQRHTLNTVSVQRHKFIILFLLYCFCSVSQTYCTLSVRRQSYCAVCSASQTYYTVFVRRHKLILFPFGVINLLYYFHSASQTYCTVLL